MEAQSNREVGRGFLFGIMMHGLQVPLGLTAALIALLVTRFKDPEAALAGWGMPLYVGVTQFIYLGPLIYRERKKRPPEFVKGMWIASAVTFLLNASCWAWFSTLRA
jgi:hypothetical protein